MRFGISGIKPQHFTKFPFGAGKVAVHQRALGLPHVGLPVRCGRLAPERSRSKQASHAAEGSGDERRRPFGIKRR